MIPRVDLNPFDNILGGIGDVLGGAAQTVGDAALQAAVQFVFGLIADAVAAITNAIASAMNATTTVNFDGGFFPELTPIRRIVLGMSTALILALLLLAVIRSLAAGEPGAIVRAVLVDVPAAVLTTMVSVTVAWLLIRVVDAASLAVTGDFGEAIGKFSASLVAVDVLTGAGLLGIIFGLLFVAGAILVWLQLLVRAALLYILIVLAPLGFATRAHPATRPIARRTVEMGVALILSKFAVAVAFGVGAAAIESSTPVSNGGGVDLSGMMTGVAAMLMAAFMPWVIWKAIPVVEAATVAAGVERSPGRSLATAASIGVATGMTASRLAGSVGGHGGLAGGGLMGGGNGSGGSGGSSAPLSAPAAGPAGAVAIAGAPSGPRPTPGGGAPASGGAASAPPRRGRAGAAGSDGPRPDLGPSDPPPTATGS